MATYEEILAELEKTRKNLPKESLSISEGSPAYEALVATYAPELAKLGTTPIPQQKDLLPSVAGQTDLQGEAATLAARQAGLIGANQSMVFNTTTGTFDFSTCVPVTEINTTPGVTFSSIGAKLGIC